MPKKKPGPPQGFKPKRKSLTPEQAVEIHAEVQKARRQRSRNVYDCRPWERLSPEQIVKEYGPIALLFSTRPEFHRWVKLTPRPTVTVDALSVRPAPLRLNPKPS